ncbi:MAG: hypothetical protein AAB091_06350 [Elusimicrobiota bacterium]|mgnify:CR=1 FL=1
MKKRKKVVSKPALARAAEQAMQEAVNGVIEECKKKRLPLAVWVKGKIAFVSGS